METNMTRAMIAAAVLAVLGAAVPVQADGISDVEGARAHERQGSYLTRQEREKLRRHGSNDDGYYSGRGYRGGYGYGYRSGPSVGIYVGPGYGYGGYYGHAGPEYYGPYGY